jgi:5-(aminomethyl)-3-furanmethanol phosphate kinase
MIERTLPLQIIKIGGSLLGTTSNRSALKNAEQWLARQTDSINVVIIGGGNTVNHLRRWQRQFNLTEGQAHLNAVQVMSLNTLKFARASCISTVTENWNELTNVSQHAGANPTTIMFDCLSFIRDVEPTLGGTPLAGDWSCTSDSIAARIAQLLGADQLTLLKSRTACSDDLWTLRYASYVDQSFPQMAADIKSVTFVDCSS